MNQDTTMPMLRFTNGKTDAFDQERLGGWHSCGYDLAGSGVLSFTTETPILHGTKGTNVIENPLLFNRSDGQTVKILASGGRLDLTGELMLPNNVSNTAMFVSGDGGEIHFGGPSPDFMGTFGLNGNITLSLDNPAAMTNASGIYFGEWHGSFTTLKNNTGAPMTFPRCTAMGNNTGWSSTRVIYSGAPFVFPVGTFTWRPRSGGTLDADMLVKNLVVAKHGSNPNAWFDKYGTGLIAVADETRWDANNVKHGVCIYGGCFWPQTATALPPSGEIFVPGGWNNFRTLGLSDDYAPMLDGSATPCVLQGQNEAIWGFTGFGGDRTVCWNADPTLNLTNTASGKVETKLRNSESTSADGLAHSDYYAYPAGLMFGNRSEFADGTIPFMNPIRYELGQNWDLYTRFESTNHVVAARMRGSLKLGNRDKTWNFSGRNFGGYLALEAENADFTGKVNVHEKGNLLVNSNLVARSATVQSGAGLGGAGSLSTEDGTTVKSGGFAGVGPKLALPFPAGFRYNLARVEHCASDHKTTRP